MELFDEYTSHYDMKVDAILRKYDHSYRVMEYGLEIASGLNLNERDTYLVRVCCMFHDIGRFEQWKRFETYVDHKSIDHGDLGYEIMYKELINKLDLNDEEKGIVLSAIRYHNKFNTPDIDPRTNMFINITRDADKLDIMSTQLLENNDEVIDLRQNMLDDIYNGYIVKNEDAYDDTGAILRIISWINDMNFESSNLVMLNHNILQDKIKLIETPETRGRLKELKNYIEETIGKKVF